MLISPLQKYEPKDWSGLTTENHLGSLYGLEPQLVSNVIEHIYNVNLGEDFISFINQFPTLYLDDDRPYEWLLQGADEKNIPLVAAYQSDLSTAVTKAGIAHSRFYMVFPERWFEATDVIVGNKPDTYKVRLVSDPILLGMNFAYEAELVTGDATLFIPAAELAAGTRWSKEYSQVEQTLSKRGGGVTHTSPFRMSNIMSMIRKEYEVPGNMIRKGENKPLAFSWKDQNGTIQTRWIKKLDWDFLVQFRKEKARLLMYGNSNKKADGTYGNKGESGYEIRSGSGFLEQISPANIFPYNTFSLDWLSEVALGLSVGKLTEDKREFVLATGEYGMYQFHKATQEKVAMWTPNFNQDRVTMNGNKMSYAGQFMEYTFINGIKFKVMHDPMMDDPVRNKVYHPNGGLAKSYEYLLMDVGTQNGESNVQKVAIKGDEEIFKYIPGFRDPFSPNDGATPAMTVSPVDGYKVMRGFIGGIRIKNPMRMARFVPQIIL